MKELVQVENGQPMVNSKDIADRFGKTHRHTLEAIKRMLADISEEFGSANFRPSSYISKQNKELPCYLLTRDGFSMLAMGFTGKEALKWKEAYIKAFNAMEHLLRGGSSVMQSLNEAMRLMEEDKQIASTCGKGLSEWKKQRKDHMEKVEKLHGDVQMLLNFKK